MNRNIFRLLIIILALYLMNGCADESPKITSAPSIQAQYSIEKMDNGYYSCKVFNKERSLIFEHTLWKKPEVTLINEQLLCFVFLEGPMASCNWGIFYDYDTDRISEKFYWVLDFTDEIVVIGNPDKLVLCSIFDDTYFKEITNFTYPIAQVADGIVSAELIDDGNTVEVTYIIADSYDITTEHIII